MPKKRRRARIPTPAWERPRGALGQRVLGRGFQFYGALVVGLLVVVALVVIGYAFLDDELEERGRPGSTAIAVEDANFRLDYFANRLTMFVSQNGGLATDVNQRASALSTVSDLLIEEEIVRRFAAEMDVTATDEEIREEIASRLGITADDESFDVVFEQELARTGISESDYLEMMEAAVLSDKLRDKFLAELPETAESVRYRQIVVSEADTADEVLKRLEEGEDFAALVAEEFNLDLVNKESGGDVGWVPRGVLDPSTEELIFALELDEVIDIPTQIGVQIISR